MRAAARGTPAQQLKSVAYRYRQNRWQAPACSARWWWLAGAGSRSATAGNGRGTRDRASEQCLVRDAKLQRLEAVLFLAREPLSSRKLSEYVNLADGTEARTLIRRLNGLYDAAGRAFRVDEVAGGFQMLSRPKFGAWLRRLQHVPSEVRLSAPLLEALAVIAYRQPVLRADIEAIRGVNCGEILRQLMERDLVRISGRSEELGRPYLYSTTKKFLQVFGLPNIDKLPHVETMRINSEVNSSNHVGEMPRDPAVALGDATGPQDDLDQTQFTRHMEESEVTVTMQAELPGAEYLEDDAIFPNLAVRARDDDEDEELGDDDDDFDDDDEETEDEDFDDEEFDDEEFDDEELEDEEIEEEDDFDDEEWEEVEDDEEEEEDDESWDDEDDEDLDDWDDDEEDEEAEEEEESDWD